MIPAIGRTITTGSEMETIPGELRCSFRRLRREPPLHWPASTSLPTPGCRPAAGPPTRGGPTSPAETTSPAGVSSAGAPACRQHLCRRGPLPDAPGGVEGQVDGYRAHALGGHSRGPPPEPTRGLDHAAAGEGHHETAGQGIRETQEAGQWADQRGSGRGYVHVYGVHTEGVYPRAEKHEHGPAVGETSWPSLELLRNTPEFPRELQSGAGELDNSVSPPWRGPAVRFSRRPRQRGSGLDATLPDAAAQPAVYRDHPGERLVVVVGSRRALAMAVRNDCPGECNSMLGIRLSGTEAGRRLLKVASSDLASFRPLKSLGR